MCVFFFCRYNLVCKPICLFSPCVTGTFRDERFRGASGPVSPLRLATRDCLQYTLPVEVRPTRQEEYNPQHVGGDRDYHFRMLPCSSGTIYWNATPGAPVWFGILFSCNHCTWESGFPVVRSPRACGSRTSRTATIPLQSLTRPVMSYTFQATSADRGNRTP